MERRIRPDTRPRGAPGTHRAPATPSSRAGGRCGAGRRRAGRRRRRSGTSGRALQRNRGELTIWRSEGPALRSPRSASGSRDGGHRRFGRTDAPGSRLGTGWRADACRGKTSRSHSGPPAGDGADRHRHLENTPAGGSRRRSSPRVGQPDVSLPRIRASGRAAHPHRTRARARVGVEQGRGAASVIAPASWSTSVIVTARS